MCSVRRSSRIRDAFAAGLLVDPRPPQCHGGMGVVVVCPGAVSRANVLAVARDGAGAELGDDGRKAIAEGRAAVEELATAATPAYGVSTGFGALATRQISSERRELLQQSLVRSHAAGAGPEVER